MFNFQKYNLPGNEITYRKVKYGLLVDTIRELSSLGSFQD